jgi:hypothetical protein
LVAGLITDGIDTTAERTSSTAATAAAQVTRELDVMADEVGGINTTGDSNLDCPMEGRVDGG